MLNDKNEDGDLEMEVSDDEDSEFDDTELVDEEERGADKIKKMREKVGRLEDEKQQLQDELQRAKAEFLNARKRLEDERTRDRQRAKIQHVEELLPLCDSFQMAMSDKVAWEKADEAWRKGVEGIHQQLQRLLRSYEVVAVDPVGVAFDPHQHEAIGTEVVTDKKLQDMVVSVVQRGYEMQVDGRTELIRPARVTTGVIE